jgi:hypothetical protein
LIERERIKVCGTEMNLKQLGAKRQNRAISREPGLRGERRRSSECSNIP